MKLNVLKLAISAAILSALSMALLPLYALYYGRGLRAVALMTGIFPGYNVSWQGAGLGLVYGFIICFIYGYLLAWIYNSLLPLKGIKMPAKAKPARKRRR